jgi:hypothetical protein
MVPSGQTARTIGMGDSEKTCLCTVSPEGVSYRSVRWSFSALPV